MGEAVVYEVTEVLGQLLFIGVLVDFVNFVLLLFFLNMVMRNLVRLLNRLFSRLWKPKHYVIGLDVAMNETQLVEALDSVEHLAAEGDNLHQGELRVVSFYNINQ